VEERVHSRADHREERHRFGEPVDRCAPLLTQQQQHRRDQRSGVTDTDPPDEVDDIERPADRLVVSPDAGADEEHLPHRVDKDQQQEEGEREAQHPAWRDLPLEDNGADLLGDRTVCMPRREDRDVRACLG
jgi:hypothetical protein